MTAAATTAAIRLVKGWQAQGSTGDAELPLLPPPPQLPPQLPPLTLLVG